MLMMAQLECWLGIFVIFQVIQTSYAKKPYNLCPPPPLLDPCNDGLLATLDSCLSGSTLSLLVKTFVVC